MELPAYRWRFVHLAALWAYGVSQPVFSMLKGNPEFLVVRGSTRSDVIVFALLVAVVPPTVVVALEAAAGVFSRALSNSLHVVCVWSFSFLVALQLVGLLQPERGVMLLVPLVPAALAVVAYLRWPPFRSFLSLSVALPVVGTLAFVATVPLAVDDAPGANVKVANPVPVVLVVFDEFPVSSILRADGSIDAVRYPNFGRLARTATWYPRATSVHDATTHAVPAILTGILPRRGELPTLADHPDNVFTLLGSRFALRASEQVTRLCPSRYCPRVVGPAPLTDRQRGLVYDVSVGYLHRVLPTALAGELPPIGERWGGFGTSSTVDVRDRVLGALDQEAWLRVAAEARGQKRGQFQAFLASLRPPRGRPALYFEHALLPHSPWRFLPSGRAYPNADAVVGMDDASKTWGPSRPLVDIALQRHLLQTGYTDRLVGVLLDRLESVGLFDRALVIVTADHGASFEPGTPMREVIPANVADIAGVPLFVKYPGQHRGRVDERDAQTIDIVPTIADVVDARIPWHVDGRSLRLAPVKRKVAVSREAGGGVVADWATVAAGVLATARRNASLFGEGTDSLYRLGPFPRLIEQPVAGLRTVEGDATSVRLVGQDVFAHVRLSSGLVPTRVTGEIDGSATVGLRLAIAVNGRVEATTRSYVRNGRTRFVAMVPDGAFVDGQNAVDVYAVSRGPDGLTLTLLGGTPARRA